MTHNDAEGQFLERAKDKGTAGKEGAPEPQEQRPTSLVSAAVGFTERCAATDSTRSIAGIRGERGGGYL